MIFIRQRCGAFSYPVNEYVVPHPRKGVYGKMGLESKYLIEKHNHLAF